MKCKFIAIFLYLICINLQSTFRPQVIWNNINCISSDLIWSLWLIITATSEPPGFLALLTLNHLLSQNIQPSEHTVNTKFCTFFGIAEHEIHAYLVDISRPEPPPSPQLGKPDVLHRYISKNCTLYIYICLASIHTS